MKSRAIARKNKIFRVDETKIRRRDDSDSIKEKLKSIRKTLRIPVKISRIGITKRIGRIRGEIDPFIAFLRFRRMFRRIKVRRKEQITVRVISRETVDEVIVRRSVRNMRRTDKELEQRVMSNGITPKIDGSKMKVLHEDKRTDVESRIISRSACRRIEGT